MSAIVFYPNYMYFKTSVLYIVSSLQLFLVDLFHWLSLISLQVYRMDLGKVTF